MANAGLHTLVNNILEPQYDDIVRLTLINGGYTPSRADFWQLAGVVAIEIGMEYAKTKVYQLLQFKLYPFVNLFCNNYKTYKHTKCMQQNIYQLQGKNVTMNLLPEFKHGRVDCPTSPTTTEMHKFPEPTMFGKEMFQYFQDMFGFTRAEVIHHHLAPGKPIKYQ